MKINKPLLTTTERAAQIGLRTGMRALLVRARELSPTDSGASDKSGFVSIDDLTGQVGFTSLVSKLQHENLDWEHADGGQAKFLEQAAEDVDVVDYVYTEIVKAFS